MGVRAAALAALLALFVSEAQAQRTTFNGILDCTRSAAVQFRRADQSFRRFVIDRQSVNEDRYSHMVGNQYVPMIYSGSATYETTAGARKVLFVCLHGGSDRGAVLVYTLPR